MKRLLSTAAKTMIIGCFFLLIIVITFLFRLEPTTTNSYPRTAIVFTGQFDRIESGAKLFREHQIDWLCISGANLGAGLRRSSFASQFALSSELTAGLNVGRIILAFDAENTVANVIEARCWLRRHPTIDAVTLIASQLHKPRASLAFERALPAGLGVVRVFSDAHEVSVREALRSGEFRKFVSTWFFCLLPSSLWTQKRIEFCL